MSFKEVSAAAGYELSYRYKSLKAAATIDEQAQYEYSDSVKLSINAGDIGDKDVAYIEDGMVYFVLTGITDKTTTVEIIVMVKGDGVQSISSEKAEKTYTVR